MHETSKNADTERDTAKGPRKKQTFTGRPSSQSNGILTSWLWDPSSKLWYYWEEPNNSYVFEDGRRVAGPSKSTAAGQNAFEQSPSSRVIHYAVAQARSSMQTASKGAEEATTSPTTASWSPQEVRAWRTYYNTLLAQGRSKDQARSTFLQALGTRSPDWPHGEAQRFFVHVLGTQEGVERPAHLKGTSSGSSGSKNDQSRPKEKIAKSSDKRPTESPMLALATIDHLNLALNRRDPSHVDLAVTYVQVADGAGQRFKRAEVLLDSGASHELISTEATRRLGFASNGSVKRLPYGQNQQVDHLKVTTPVNSVVQLSWQFDGKPELYGQLFYVVDDLPFDMIISFSTINQFSLFSKGLQYHKINGDNNLKLNAYVLKKQPKAVQKAQATGAQQKQEKNEAERKRRADEQYRQAAAERAAAQARQAAANEDDEDDDDSSDSE